MPPKRSRKATAAIIEAPAKRARVTKGAASAPAPPQPKETASASAPAKKPGRPKSTRTRASKQQVQPRQSPPREESTYSPPREQPSLSSSQAESNQEQESPQQLSVNTPSNIPVSSDLSSLLVNTFEKVLTSVRDASNHNNVQIMSRMSTERKLPYFSGNPLEWMHFKEMYKLTTEIGGYSNRENIARLHEALRGEAREIVGTILATSRDPEMVMNTLELNYGDKNVLAEKITSEIYELPRLDSKKLSLIQFATKLQNGITSLKTFCLTGHLHNPHLIISPSSNPG